MKTSSNSLFLCALLLLHPSLSPSANGEPPPCDRYAEPVELGRFLNPSINESSGLVLSRNQPGVIWTHNDSGDGPYIYAATYTGADLGRWHIQGIQARDWEDIAIAPCAPNADRHCLYIGDIGNNDNNRDDLQIILVEEPTVDLGAPPGQQHTSPYLALLPFQWPEENYDAESLLVHPESAEIYLVAKVMMGASGLYRYPRESQDPRPTLERLAEATFGILPLIEQATTGADFARDGTRFTVRTYSQLYTFRIPPEGTIADAFTQPNLAARVANERQGEAITYGPDDRSLWTTTEGQPALIQNYACLEAQSPVDTDTDTDTDTSTELTPALDTSELALEPEDDPPHPHDLGPGDPSIPSTPHTPSCCAILHPGRASGGAALLILLGLPLLTGRANASRA